MIDSAAMPGAMGAVAIVIAASAICAVLIVVLRPLLRRYALARPNARSSHREPTPQGGGIAVLAATIAAVLLAHMLLGAAIAGPLATVFGAAVLIACVGAADDIRPMAVVPRLLLQTVAVALVIHVLPDDLRIVGALPWWLERVLLVVGGLWFVNLVNFMDGIDLMTVAEVVPITAALVCLGILGAVPVDAVTLALALGGAMLGFAWFNRPVAKLFLGDVGSLPIGLLLGWLLALTAGNGHLAAALLLPLYYLADATITLLRRLARGERFWEAHRSHFYQRATDNGWSVTRVVTGVALANVVLAALALATVIVPGVATDIMALACGSVTVAVLMRSFVRPRA